MLLHDYLIEQGFTQSYNILICVCTKQTHDCCFILLVWVDDIIIAARSEDVLQNETQTLSKWFKMKDLGLLSLFLNIQFDFEGDCVTMHQDKYIKEMLYKFRIND